MNTQAEEQEMDLGPHIKVRYIGSEPYKSNFLPAHIGPSIKACDVFSVQRCYYRGDDRLFFRFDSGLSVLAESFPVEQVIELDMEPATEREEREPKHFKDNEYVAQFIDRIEETVYEFADKLSLAEVIGAIEVCKTCMLTLDEEEL